MDSLYILKERLEDAAIRGTDALASDAALASAVDALRAEDLVLYGEARALTAAAPEERPARLLRTFAMVSAELCETAETEPDGEIAPLTGGDGVYVRAPYSRVRGLIDALTGVGVGRISILEEAWKKYPSLFGDARVLPYVIGALGSAYDELEDLLAAILLSQGARVVPLLKECFRPDGKRDMARRVYLIAKLGGEEQNDWLLSVLPESAGEARESIITALGQRQENAPLLRELYPKETGKHRDALLRALARMDDEESRALWEEELERRPDCPPCLEGVDTTLAADLAAKVLRGAVGEALSRGETLLGQAEVLTLAHAAFVAYGKYSEALRELWFELAEQMPALDALKPDGAPGCDLTAAELLEKCLLETVLWNPSRDVCALARDLGAKYPAWFLGGAVLADLLARPAEAFGLYGRYIVKNGLFRKESDADRANRIQIMRALAAVRRTDEDGLHIPFVRKDGFTGAPVAKLYRVTELDPRWAATLGDPKVGGDGSVFDLADAWSLGKRMFRLDELAPPRPEGKPEEKT